MTRRNRLSVAAVSAVALMLGGASLAWACTAASDFSSANPRSGEPGTVVTVAGSQFSDGPVEIRWANRNGLELATATGPAFAAEVTVPGARPGNYLLVAVDSTTGVARSLAFEVTEPQPVETPPPPPPPDRGPDNPGPGLVTPPEPPPVTPEQPAPPTPETPAVAPAPADEPASSAPAPVVRPRADGGTSPAPSASAPAPVPQAAAAPAVQEQVPSVDELSSSALSVDGDLWSGFASGSDSALEASLLDEPANPSSGPARTLGIALFAAGLVSLFAGFTAATVTRRRSRAELS